MGRVKRKYVVNTHGMGVFFRWATSAKAARQRVVDMVFGRGYDGWDHEYWTVTEVTQTKGGES